MSHGPIGFSKPNAKVPPTTLTVNIAQGVKETHFLYAGDKIGGSGTSTATVEPNKKNL